VTGQTNLPKVAYRFTCESPHSNLLVPFFRRHSLWWTCLDLSLANFFPICTQRRAIALDVALHHGPPSVLVGILVKLFEEMVDRVAAVVVTVVFQVISRNIFGLVFFGGFAVSSLASLSQSFGPVFDDDGYKDFSAFSGAFPPGSLFSVGLSRGVPSRSAHFLPAVPFRSLTSTLVDKML